MLNKRTPDFKEESLTKRNKARKRSIFARFTLGASARAHRIGFSWKVSKEHNNKLAMMKKELNDAIEDSKKEESDDP